MLLLAGNHEFYENSIEQMRVDLRKATSGTPISFLDNDSVDFGGVRFLGTTLCTDYRVDLNRGCRVVANPQGYARNVGSAAKVGALDFENRNFGWACVIEV